MTPPPKPSRFSSNLPLFLFVLLLIVFHAGVTRADSTDGSTPLALQPGAPAGSYALSNLDNINPYNGSLNFRLPLVSIRGRGTAGYTMTLPIEQKWRINVLPIYNYVFEDGGGPPLPEPQVDYYYFPSANWWAGIKPGYGPGVLQGRVGQFDAQVCADTTMRAVMTLTRLTFTAPDGTEFELRDEQTDGAAAGVGLCDAIGLNRGKKFVTSDGSAATFISDQNITDYIGVPNTGNDVFYPSGYLLMRDGTRYRFDNGTITWLRDRNGNKMTFTYDSFKRMTLAKDSINREVTVTYATSSIAYDEIIYKGFNGAPRTLRVNYAQLGDAGSLRSGYSIQSYSQLFPIVGSSMSGTYNPKIIRSVTLPNNQQYQFQYNPHGELARVVLPTGGAFEYDHSGGFGGGDASGVVGGGDGPNVYRRVTTRRAYDDGSTMTAKTTISGQQIISGNTNYVLVDQFGNDGTTRLNQKKLYFEGFAENSFLVLPTDYSPWKDGREFQSDAVAADGSTVLRRTAQTWQQPVAGQSWPLVQAETNAAAKSNNPQTTQIVTTLEPGQANKVSKQTFTYDKYSNQTDLYEYDFGSGTAGSLVRRTRTDYLTSSYDTLNPTSSSPDMALTAHIRNLPLQVSVFDSGGTERSRSVIEYDNYVLDGSDCQHSFHCALTARANISEHDSSFTTSYTKRGNPTALTRYLLSNGSVTGSISTYSQYDVAGNVVRSLDPRSTLSNNIATTIEYDDRFGAPDTEARGNSAPNQLSGLTTFAFATKVINALGHTAYAQFDYYLGKTVNGEDANGIVAGGSFNDPLDRPTQIRRAIGTGAENQTTFSYDDGGRVVTTSSDRDAYGDNVLVSKVLYDQVGRTVETRQYEGGTNYIATQTQYDSLGRPFKTSNPFRPWQSETAVWTTQAFDALGRLISSTTPDNAAVLTTYSGNSLTATDQAGKARKSVTDALGRLVDVYEDPAGLNYQTSYNYDVLDNHVKVTQGSQQRIFMYDSLNRLVRSRNPEQGTNASLNLSDPLTGNSAWSTGYQYDPGSNPTQKTDARGVVSVYAYDALNRNTTVDYSDTASINPDVKRFYDGATNGKGLFWYFYSGGDFSTGSNVDHTSIDSYDALGRPLVQRQLFKINGTWSPAYQVLCGYNRAGSLTSQTYPSGRAVAYSYDPAGRTSSFTGNLGDGVQRTYTSGVTYSKWGGISREEFGTTSGVYHKLHYNIRGQLYDVRISSNPNDEWAGELGALVNYYSTWWAHGGSGPDNNGNVLMSQTIINSYYMEDRYSYDTLNRLTAVNEHQNGATHTGSQQYTYDRWGNRTINPASWGTGINTKQFTVDTTTNRLGVPGGQPGVRSYDSAGNVTNDTYTSFGSRTYDANNKMISAQDSYAGWSYYTYNANGQRTRRKINNQETWQVHGFDGELLAEYVAGNAVSDPQKEYGYRNGQLLITATAGSGLVGHWKANENSGTWTADAAGNASSGTLTSGAGWATGQSGSAVNLDGVNDYVQVGPQSSLVLTNAASFSAWIYPTGPGSDPTHGGTILAKEGEYAIARYPNGTIRWGFANSNPGWTFVDTGYVAALNQWTHIAITYQNGTIKTYANGSLVYTYGGAGAIADAIPGQNDFRIGGRQVISQHFNGRIDEVRVYSRALTPTEVSALATGPAGVVLAINWLVPDHLGTPRMILDQTGTLANIKRHDYLPFGEELYAPAGGRISALGYSNGEGARQQFTEKERDTETGLDYFGARYYASVQGGFTSPDPILLGPARLFDPQRLNRYGHARQNPIKFIDPDGEDLVPTNQTSAIQLKADLDKLLTQAEAANITVEAGKNVAIINSSAITNPSTAYQLLLKAIRPGVRREYNAVPEDSTVTLKSGHQVNISSGMAVFSGKNVKENGEGATLIEIFVPTRDGPQVWGEDSTPVDLPRFIITGHEALAHGTCGRGLCAVDLENKMRDDVGLPRRSGSEHETLLGQQLRPGSQIPPTHATVTAGFDLIPLPPPPPPTFLVPKALRKLPNN